MGIFYDPRLRSWLPSCQRFASHWPLGLQMSGENDVIYDQVMASLMLLQVGKKQVNRLLVKRMTVGQAVPRVLCKQFEIENQRFPWENDLYIWWTFYIY